MGLDLNVRVTGDSKERNGAAVAVDFGAFQRIVMHFIFLYVASILVFVTEKWFVKCRFLRAGPF